MEPTFILLQSNQYMAYVRASGTQEERLKGLYGVFWNGLYGMEGIISLPVSGIPEEEANDIVELERQRGRNLIMVRLED